MSEKLFQESVTDVTQNRQAYFLASLRGTNYQNYPIKKKQFCGLNITKQ